MGAAVIAARPLPARRAGRRGTDGTDGTGQGQDRDRTVLLPRTAGTAAPRLPACGRPAMALSSERLFDSLGHFGRYWGCAAVAPGHPRVAAGHRSRLSGCHSCPGGDSAVRPCAPGIAQAAGRWLGHAPAHTPAPAPAHGECRTQIHSTALSELTEQTGAAFAALDTPHALFRTHAAPHACARSRRAAHPCVCRARTDTHTAPQSCRHHVRAATHSRPCTLRHLQLTFLSLHV